MIKITSHLLGWLLSKRQEKTDPGEDVEKREPLYIVCGNVNLAPPPWKTIWSFLKKLKIDLPYDSAIPLLGIYPKEMKTRF